jgi:hypothetical protein
LISEFKKKVGLQKFLEKIKFNDNHRDDCDFEKTEFELSLYLQHCLWLACTKCFKIILVGIDPKYAKIFIFIQLPVDYVKRKEEGFLRRLWEFF